jgi:hypothetical protein
MLLQPPSAQAGSGVSGEHAELLRRTKIKRSSHIPAGRPLGISLAIDEGVE